MHGPCMIRKTITIREDQDTWLKVENKNFSRMVQDMLDQRMAELALMRKHMNNGGKEE